MECKSKELFTIKKKKSKKILKKHFSDLLFPPLPAAANVHYNNWILPFYKGCNENDALISRDQSGPTFPPGYRDQSICRPIVPPNRLKKDSCSLIEDQGGGTFAGLSSIRGCTLL